jgi:hypothetical protein
MARQRSFDRVRRSPSPSFSATATAAFQPVPPRQTAPGLQQQGRDRPLPDWQPDPSRYQVNVENPLAGMYGHRPSMPIQAKLAVGPTGDRHEQEADQVAAQVVDHINEPKMGGAIAPLGHRTDAPRNIASTAQQAPQATSVQATTLQRKKGKKQATDAANQAFAETGTAPQDAYFIVKAAVKTGTKNRGALSWSDILGGGSGHSWLVLQLGPNHPNLDALEDSTPDGQLIRAALGNTTRNELEATRESTIGFYPNIQSRPNTRSNLAKQIFSSLPGKIIEPEQPHFKGSERGNISFAITDSTQAITLLNFINRHRTHPYNIMKYNCTDFVVKALKAIGYSVGVSSKSAMTTPAQVYKHIYERAELGDQTAQYTDLKNTTNSSGKVIDTKHVSKKRHKKIEKRKRKMAPILRAREQARNWARVVETHRNLAFVPIRSGGLTRPETEWGFTGAIEGDYGEAVDKDNHHICWLHLQTLAQRGVIYPGYTPENNTPAQEPDNDPQPNAPVTDEQIEEALDNI